MIGWILLWQVPRRSLSGCARNLSLLMNLYLIMIVYFYCLKKNLTIIEISEK